MSHYHWWLIRSVHILGTEITLSLYRSERVVFDVVFPIPIDFKFIVLRSFEPERKENSTIFRHDPVTGTCDFSKFDATESLNITALRSVIYKIDKNSSLYNCLPIGLDLPVDEFFCHVVATHLQLPVCGMIGVKESLSMKVPLFNSKKKGVIFPFVRRFKSYEEFKWHADFSTRLCRGGSLPTFEEFVDNGFSKQDIDMYNKALLSISLGITIDVIQKMLSANEKIIHRLLFYFLFYLKLWSPDSNVFIRTPTQEERKTPSVDPSIRGGKVSSVNGLIDPTSIAIEIDIGSCYPSIIKDTLHGLGDQSMNSHDPLVSVIGILLKTRMEIFKDKSISIKRFGKDSIGIRDLLKEIMNKSIGDTGMPINEKEVFIPPIRCPKLTGFIRKHSEVVLQELGEQSIKYFGEQYKNSNPVVIREAQDSILLRLDNCSDEFPFIETDLTTKSDPIPMEGNYSKTFKVFRSCIILDKNQVILFGIDKRSRLPYLDLRGLVSIKPSYDQNPKMKDLQSEWDPICQSVRIHLMEYLSARCADSDDYKLSEATDNLILSLRDHVSFLDRHKDVNLEFSIYYKRLMDLLDPKQQKLSFDEPPKPKRMAITCFCHKCGLEYQLGLGGTVDLEKLKPEFIGFLCDECSSNNVSVYKCTKCQKKRVFYIDSVCRFCLL